VEARVKGERGAIVFMIGVVLIWGVNVSVMKSAVSEVSPLVFNALRFPLGTTALALLVWRLESRPWPAQGEWAPLARLGLSAHPLYQLLFLNGLNLTSASHAAVLVSTTPIWIALSDHYVGHERLPRQAWAGILLSMAGVVLLVVARGSGGEPSSLFGDALVLGSGLIWTYYVIGSRPMLRSRSPLWVTGWALFIGAPFVVAMGLPGLFALRWGAVSAPTWGGVVFAGLLALATAYSWWAIGVQRIGAARTAVFSNLIPVVALGVAWIWLGERLALLAWVGAAAALAGVWLTSVSRRAVSGAAQPD
jgi:drug/metabolite transporter (DMT)-like permease